MTPAQMRALRNIAVDALEGLRSYADLISDGCRCNGHGATCPSCAHYKARLSLRQLICAIDDAAEREGKPE